MLNLKKSEFIEKRFRTKIAPNNGHRMHLPCLADPVSENFKTNWSKSVMLVEDNSNTTTSSSTSPPKSQNPNVNEYWWTERMVIRAQEEFPNELGSK